MQNKSRAFTLIELLVVVLIIGILAAVAVPQYQTAVDKSRLLKVDMLLQSVWKMQQVFFLANGRYAVRWDELADLDMPNPTSGGGESNYIYFEDGLYCFLQPQYGGCGISSNAMGLVRLVRYWQADNRGYYCYASQNSLRANRFCQTFTGTSAGTPNGSDYLYTR